MRNPFRRAVTVPPQVVARAGLSSGERVLTGAVDRDGTWLLGTRDAFVVVPAGERGGEVRRVPWQQVRRADWDRDEDRLVVSEVADFGEPLPEHTFRIDQPGLLLDLIRERVTASVVLQRRVVVEGRKGLFVLARRAPHGGGEVTWAYEFDAGVDPSDPRVMEAARRGLDEAAQELGL